MDYASGRIYHPESYRDEYGREDGSRTILAVRLTLQTRQNCKRWLFHPRSDGIQPAADAPCEATGFEPVYWD